MSTQRWVFLVGILFSILTTACHRDPAAARGKEDDARQEVATGTIATSFYPLQYFAERIADSLVEVICPLPPEADPSLWFPSGDAIQAFQRADLILINGTAFEKWLNKVSLPPSRIADTTRFLSPEEQIRYESTITHRHGPTGEHSHEGLDGHTWMDPLLALNQAQSISEAMARRWPQHQEAFADNLQGLLQDLRALDQRLQRFSSAWAERGGQLVASHPAYNYLAKRYRLPVVNLDLNPEAAPTQDTLKSIAVYPGERFSEYLLWETEPTATVATTLESIGFRNVLFSPCETRPDQGDYLTVMQGNLTRLEALVESEKTE